MRRNLEAANPGAAEREAQSLLGRGLAPVPMTRPGYLEQRQERKEEVAVSDAVSKEEQSVAESGKGTVVEGTSTEEKAPNVVGAAKSDAGVTEPVAKPKMSERMLRVRSGSRKEDYVRDDGVATRRYTLTLPTAVIKEIDHFAVDLPYPWDKNMFAAQALQEGKRLLLEGLLPLPARVQERMKKEQTE